MILRSLVRGNLNSIRQILQKKWPSKRLFNSGTNSNGSNNLLQYLQQVQDTRDYFRKHASVNISKIHDHSIKPSNRSTFPIYGALKLESHYFWTAEFEKRQKRYAQYEGTEIQKLSATCLNLMEMGHWEEDFKMLGFDRIVNGQTVSNPLHINYPLQWPPYRYWSEQNYTGTWSSNESCTISQFKTDGIKTCLGKSSVMIIGDSRARQLYRAIKSVLLDFRNQLEHPCVFYPGTHWCL